MPSIIRPASSFATWTAFSIGTILNIILLRFIHQKTPKQMKIYSKILLQTCYTDLLLLLATLIADPLFFVTSKGSTQIIVNGPFPIYGTAGLICFAIWVFLVYVSLFGFVAQFIYRYCLLNWNFEMNAFAYFGMLIAILCIPLPYCLIFAKEFYAFSDGPKYLDDPEMANFLGFNISVEPVPLSGLSNGSPLFLWAMYYIIGACTLAYAIISTLGWLMYKYIKNQPILKMLTMEQKKIAEMHNQVSRILLIQGTMPLSIYIPLLILLLSMLVGIDLNRWTPFIHYYDMLISFIPQFIPAAINPIVSFFSIKTYRAALIRAIRSFAKMIICSKNEQPAAEFQTNSKIFTTTAKNLRMNEGNRVNPIK